MLQMIHQKLKQEDITQYQEEIITPKKIVIF